MINKTLQRHAVLLIFFCATFIFWRPALAVPIPTITVPDMPAENFVGEQFCLTATFTNTGTTGYGPYYQLFLKPDFSLASAQLFGNAVTTTLVGTFPSITTDPISGDPVSGPAGSSFYTIEPPVGSVTNGSAPLNTQICIDVDANAIHDVPQSDAVQFTPGFMFGDSPTGGTPIAGSMVSNPLTPRIITFSEDDLTAEDETPPGPAFTYNIEAVADIAADRTVAPITFPRIELTDNRQFVGPITNTGGTSCTATVTNSLGVSESGPLPFSPTHMTMPGGYIDVECASGTGTIGSDRDIVILAPVYATNNLNLNACSFENNVTRNISKHMVVRKYANLVNVRPGSTITYTLNFAVTEFANTENVVITDVMPDGLTYSGIQSMTINGSTVAISPVVSDNNPSGGQTTVTYDVSTAYGATFAATSTGSITYTATVDETYSDGESIRANDNISNSALIEYSVVGGAGAAPNFCTDSSSANVRVLPITISKTMLSTQTEYYPGDTVRFRLQMNIPSGDTKDIVITDYMPLPALKVNTFSTNTNLASNPNISLGPNDTLGLTPQSITTNGTSNSFTITWPDVNSGTPEVIEVDIDAIIVTTDPFADNLFLTNIFELNTQNTLDQSTAQYDAVSFTVRSPDVSIAKSVTPTSNVDAGDTVNYTINLVNNGGSSAYDVIARDVLPAGISSCSIASAPAGSGDLFSLAGYALSTPMAANGGTASFTFACTLGYDIQISTTHTNTGYVSFASAVGALRFPERSDTATFSTSPPTPTKAIVSTDKSHTVDGTADTNGAPRPVSIGETIRYRLSTQIPEGTAGAAIISDALPAGLKYVEGSAMVALVSTGGITSAFTCTTGGGLNVVGNSPAVVPGCGINANGSSFGSGTDPVFNVGDLVNNDNDADDEFIVIEFDAIVMSNALVNQQAYKSNNRFRANFNGVNFSYSNRVYTIVREPQITVVPTVSAPTTNDVILSLDVSNTGQATAFQVTGDSASNWSFTLPNGLQSMSNPVLSVTGNVFENNTTTTLTAADFVISGSLNETITLLKPLQFDPGAKFVLSFSAEVIPGATPATSISTSVFEYASQVTGNQSIQVRTAENLNTGSGNAPINNQAVANDYRTETQMQLLGIRGKVYVDTNSNASFTAGESGIPGVTVVLRDTSDNSCRSMKTNAAGEYNFFPTLPGSYQVIESAQESTPVPSQCPPQALDPVGYTSTSSNTRSVTLSTTNAVNQDFGDLSGPMLSPDHTGQVMPGNVVFYTHKFTTPADGNVTFSTTAVSQSGAGWQNIIYRDTNCDGILNGAEANAPITTSSISGGGEICLINKVFAPSNVPTQDQYEVIINAEFTYSGGGLGVANLTATDVTISSDSSTDPSTGEGASRLELRKTVENTTQGTVETDTLNQASPNDVLKYRIYYHNTGTGPITDLNINDTVPAYTTILGSPSCDITLGSLSCLSGVSGDSIEWTFVGTLQGGGQGHVSFDVVVDN